MAINDALLAKVKACLRISHTALDEDVSDNIAACLADLQVCGVMDSKLDATQELDPLVLNAVKSYCKAAYTDDPAKAARYQEGYEAQRSRLRQAEGYGYEEADADD